MFYVKKTVTSFWKKKNPRQMGRVHELTFRRSEKRLHVMKCNFAGPPIMKDEVWQQ